MYMNTLLQCHFCIQIIINDLLLSKVSGPIHTIPGINTHLLYPILCPWKYSIRLILPCMYFWLFPWQPTLYSILTLFLYLGGSTGSRYHQYGETLCVKMGSMNGFIADCSRYVFWFHIISQSGNALLASQSGEVTIAGCGLVVARYP